MTVPLHRSVKYANWIGVVGRSESTLLELVCPSHGFGGLEGVGRWRRDRAWRLVTAGAASQPQDWDDAVTYRYTEYYTPSRVGENNSITHIESQLRRLRLCARRHHIRQQTLATNFVMNLKLGFKLRFGAAGRAP